MNLPVGENGAIVESVAPDKSAAAAGIQPGDIILSVNQKTVDSAKAARQIVSEARQSGKKSILLLMLRGGTQTFVTVAVAGA